MNEYYIIVPRIGTNDESVTIGIWQVKSGDYVEEGQVIVSLETTKETEDIIAERTGYLFYAFETGMEVKVGDQLAVISQNADYKFGPDEIESLEYNITNKARELAEKYHLDLSVLKGKDIIREKDILPLIDVTESEVVRTKANDLIIVTGGGPAHMCIELIIQNKAYNIHGIVDPVKKAGELVNGIPVLGDESILPSLRKDGYMTAVVSKGSIANENLSNQFHMRKSLFNMVKQYDFFAPTLIHPTASVATTARIGEGTQIYEHAAIGTDAIIGNNCLINTGAIISHNCQIGSHTRISPGATLAGNVIVGENALIGMGTTIYMGVKIGANTIIANGKNIFNDVPAGSIIK